MHGVHVGSAPNAHSVPMAAAASRARHDGSVWPASSNHRPSVTPYAEVLVVEDDPLDLALTLRALRASHVEHIAVAHDGAEALEYLASDAASGRGPRLVLLDLDLPRVAGLEVLRRMRQDDRMRAIPVVVLSSSHDELDRARSYEIGANAFVSKPVDYRDLVRAARELGRSWLGHRNSSPPR